MANDIATRQWRLDTPRVFGTPGSIIWDSNVYIKNIEFTGYASQGNQCIVKDRNGRIIWSATGSTTLAPIRLGDIGWADGLVLDTLSSGLCVVYIR
jgi:hypothetical protein